MSRKRHLARQIFSSTSMKNLVKAALHGNLRTFQEWDYGRATCGNDDFRLLTMTSVEMPRNAPTRPADPSNEFSLCRPRRPMGSSYAQPSGEAIGKRERVTTPQENRKIRQQLA